MRAVQDTFNVTLHAKELDIHHVSIASFEKSTKKGKEKSGKTKKTKASFATSPDNNDFLVVTADRPLQQGEHYIIEIHFKGHGRGSEGFFRASESVYATQFGATHARRAFPCFDEPDLKAKFKIVLTCDEKYSVISNMPMDKGKS